MKVKKVQLINFRNHAESALEFSDGINIITGANAQGKTSILEALSYVCLTKSFLQQPDDAVRKFGADAFSVDALMEKDSGMVNRVRFTSEAGGGKKYLLDNNEVRRSADVIGMFPIVVLAPKDFALTSGAPSERRQFADMVLSQVSHAYLEELLEYRRALKQRNKILLDAKLNDILDREILAAWTDALVLHGTRVMAKRAEFASGFQETFRRAYSLLVEFGEVPGLLYEPSFRYEANISQEFHAALEKLAAAERARGSTLAGPHRDDIGFMLNEKPIREFASQGQHKTFLVALKIAEFHYIREMLGETPAMLLDDVMTELDYSRATKTVRAVAALGQTFITATDLLSYDEKLLDTRETKYHFVREGNVVYEDA